MVTELGFIPGWVARNKWWLDLLSGCPGFPGAQHAFNIFGKIPLLNDVGTNINLVVYTPELFIVQLSTLLYYLITVWINKL